jgi:hypothetical protein
MERVSGRAMTILKWLVIIALLGYAGGFAALFLLQRSFLFPIPQTRRTTPAAAGFPEAEEHILTTADGETSSSGMSRPNPAIPWCSISTAMAIFSPVSLAAFTT